MTLADVGEVEFVVNDARLAEVLRGLSAAVPLFDPRSATGVSVDITLAQPPNHVGNAITSYLDLNRRNMIFYARGRNAASTATTSLLSYTTPPESTRPSVSSLSAFVNASRISHRATTSAFWELERTISESKWIIDPSVTWDDDVTYAESTWVRATSLLSTLALRVAFSAGTRFPLPIIGPAERGSVDLYWDAPGGQLLINVPASADRKETFSWRSASGEHEFGVLESIQISSVVEWLLAL
jgi:hypothetical protein